VLSERLDDVDLLQLRGERQRRMLVPIRDVGACVRLQQPAHAPANALSVMSRGSTCGRLFLCESLPGLPLPGLPLPMTPAPSSTSSSATTNDMAP